MNERREISFLLTVEDHIAFNMLQYRRLPFWQRQGQILVFGGVLLYALVMYSTIGARMDLSHLITNQLMLLPLAGVVFTLGFMGFRIWRALPWSIPSRVRALLAKPQHRHRLGEKTLSIGPEGISEQSEGAETLIRWDMLEAVKVTDDHAFFLYSQRNGLILPRRAFPGEEDFKDFLNRARQYHEGTESVSETPAETFRPQPPREEGFGSNPPRGSESSSVVQDDEQPRTDRRELSFVLTVDDHIAFNVLLHQRLPFWRRYLRPIVMMSAMFFIGSWFIFSIPAQVEGFDLLTKLLMLGMILVLSGGLVAFSLRLQAWQRVQAVRTMLAHPENRKFVTEMTVVITPEEIISHSMTGTTSIRWDRIEEIVVTAKHAFFFFSERGGLVLPKRPLQGAEFEEFVALARRYHEGPGDDPEIPPTPPEERIASPDVFRDRD